MADKVLATLAAKAVNYEWSKSAEGAPQIAVAFRICDAEAGERKGRSYTWFGSFTDSKMGNSTVAERTVQSLLHCGARMRDDDPTDLEGLTKNEIDLVITEHTYEGKLTERASFVNPRGAIFVKNKMEEGEKKEFAMGLKGIVGSVRKNAARGASESGGVPVGADGKPIF